MSKERNEKPEEPEQSKFILFGPPGEPIQPGDEENAPVIFAKSISEPVVDENGDISQKMSLTFKNSLLLIIQNWGMHPEVSADTKKEIESDFIVLYQYLADLRVKDFNAEAAIRRDYTIEYIVKNTEGKDREQIEREVNNVLCGNIVMLALLTMYNEIERYLELKSAEEQRLGVKSEPVVPPPPVKALPSNKEFYKYPMHGLKNQFGTSDTATLFSPEIVDNFKESYDVSITNKIDRYGMDLTDTQFRVLEAILKAFDATGYKGTEPPKTKKEIKAQEYRRASKMPATFDNVDSLPRIRLGQREITRLSGLNEEAQKDRQEVDAAINFLGQKQCCFYYKRLVYDSAGRPVREHGSNNYKKEEVTSIDTAINLKIVTDEETKVFKYYEVEPSSIWLDQLNSYYVLVRIDWRDEVKRVLQRKRLSSYLMLFLMWLNLQYEEVRRYNNGKPKGKCKPYEIKRDWKNIARAIRIPDSAIKTKRKWVNDVLEAAYRDAQTLGYITSFSREEVHILRLNPDKYYNPIEALGAG